jgi:hypothetical protein
MRFRDKNGPTLYPILKPPDLPDFFAAARNRRHKSASSVFKHKTNPPKPALRSWRARWRPLALVLMTPAQDIDRVGPHVLAHIQAHEFSILAEKVFS